MLIKYAKVETREYSDNWLLAKRRPNVDKAGFDKYKIRHNLTKFRSWRTNGQVEVFNRLLKEQTTKKYFYEKVKELNEHVMSFIIQLPKKTKEFKVHYAVRENNRIVIFIV